MPYFKKNCSQRLLLVVTFSNKMAIVVADWGPPKWVETACKTAQSIFRKTRKPIT